jgi:hypothetical protein
MDMKKNEIDDQNICCRRILSSMISIVSLNSGFDQIETTALETLTEALGACNLKYLKIRTIIKVSFISYLSAFFAS